MKIATWNVNSIRTRQDHIIQWLKTHPVDVLCLQETKVRDEQFPRSPFEELGYHLYISGQKAYNGVAIFSREEMQAVSRGFTPILDTETAQSFDEQKRVITGIINGIRIVNLYVPNGSSAGSEKYEYKLQWLQLLREYLTTLLTQTPKLCMCGDFNIALEDRDIHDPKNRANHIMATEAERTALHNILELGFTDAFRQFTPEPGHFSWWDYRAASFPRNRGWRIDHHYLSTPLQPQAIACTIDIEPRGWDKPSDHTPVIVELSS
ncbi:MAG: exodeoxyribonuclease III [Microcoleaceae cyanobacterium]